MHASEHNSQRILTFRDGDEVDVIRHQAVRQNANLCFAEILAQELEVKLAVADREKNSLMIGPPVG